MATAPERTGTAVAFPGMGPLAFSDVAKFLVLNPVARRRLAEADEVLGYPLLDRFADSEGEYSEHAQVAFLVSCLALAEWARSTLDAEPDVCAGASFGGKAAAVHAGALDFADAVTLTARLARHEHDYFTRAHGDLVTLSFTRLPSAGLAALLAEMTEQGRWHDVSCYVDDDFHMVSMKETDAEWFAERLRAEGGMPLYTMRPAMHTPVLADLRAEVEAEVFAGIGFRDPVVPVVADQDGGVVTDAAGVRRMLLDGYTHPVRWPAMVDTLVARGIGTLHMCGPDALFGRVRVTTANFTVVQVNPAMAMRPRRRAPARA